MADVYLSFADADAALADHLTERATARGLTVVRSDGIFASYSARTEALNCAGHIIVILSSRSVSSLTVLGDAGVGIARGTLIVLAAEILAPGDIPAGLRGYEPIPASDADTVIEKLSQRREPREAQNPDTSDIAFPDAGADSHAERAQAEHDALYRKRMAADDVPPTVDSASTTQASRDELYRQRMAKTDDPPTIGSAPMREEPAPAAAPYFPALPSMTRSADGVNGGPVNDRLSVDNLSSWTAARIAASRRSVPLSEPSSRPAPTSAPSVHRPSTQAPSMPARSGGPGGGTGFVAFALTAALGLASAWFLFGSEAGRDIAGKLLAVIGLKLNAFSFLGFRSKSKAEPETIDCSVFSPPAARPGSTVLVQVFLHRPAEAERAQFMAEMMDQTTALKGVQTLQVSVARGDTLTVSLTATGLDIDEPQQAVVWRGEPVFCQFLVTLPNGVDATTFHPVVRIAVTGSPVGRIVFALKADRNAASATSAPQGETARRYEHAFLSYASPDRKEVLKRAQALQAAGVSFFQDTLSLDPGVRWTREIYKHIDKCDLFLLFWSGAAADSEWVIKEAEYALARQNDGDEPDIVPVILESPPRLPPESLAALHFNDRTHHLIAAS